MDVRSRVIVGYRFIKLSKVHLIARFVAFIIYRDKLSNLRKVENNIKCGAIKL